MNMHTREELAYRQALPLSMKVAFTKTRIRQWVDRFGLDGIYLSYSGGKDSTVLSHILDDMYPGNEIKRVFVDTGLEYPEIREFVKRDPRAVFLKPKLTFKQVIEKYGYPFISKETSACVYGARMYLTKIAEQTAQSDSTAQHSTAQHSTAQHSTKLPYKWCIDRISGTGAYRKRVSSPLPNGDASGEVRKELEQEEEGDYP